MGPSPLECRIDKTGESETAIRVVRSDGLDVDAGWMKCPNPCCLLGD
jgi:hypothetical protein